MVQAMSRGEKTRSRQFGSPRVEPPTRDRQQDPTEEGGDPDPSIHPTHRLSSEAYFFREAPTCSYMAFMLLWKSSPLR
jgi:hypothetical protein